MAPENTPSQAGEPATPAGTVSIPLVEAEGLQPIYANFVKVSSAPEEIVLDFGLNLNLPGAAPTAIKISQRLVMNYYTAKRLWATLAQSLQRHEQAFGVVETDVNKRVIPAAQRPGR
jgi:hypothetical protein